MNSSPEEVNPIESVDTVRLDMEKVEFKVPSAE